MTFQKLSLSSFNCILQMAKIVDCYVLQFRSHTFLNDEVHLSENFY